MMYYWNPKVRKFDDVANIKDDIMTDGKLDDQKIQEYMIKLDLKVKEDPKNHCRICGTYVPTSSSSYRFSNGVIKIRLCSDCKDISFEKVIRITNEGDPKKCQKCMSHPNACECPERKVLREIRK